MKRFQVPARPNQNLFVEDSGDDAASAAAIRDRSLERGSPTLTPPSSGFGRTSTRRSGAGNAAAASDFTTCSDAQRKRSSVRSNSSRSSRSSSSSSSSSSKTSRSSSSSSYETRSSPVSFRTGSPVSAPDTPVASQAGTSTMDEISSSSSSSSSSSTLSDTPAKFPSDSRAAVGASSPSSFKCGREPLVPWPLVACLGIGAAGLAMGVVANGGGTKYIRLLAQDGCATTWKNIGAPVTGQTECCTAFASASTSASSATVLTSTLSGGKEELQLLQQRHDEVGIADLDGGGGGGGGGGAGGEAEHAGWRRAAEMVLAALTGPPSSWSLPQLSGSVCASEYKMERALATFTGAWLLPLTPLLLDWLFGDCRCRCRTPSSSSSSSASSSASSSSPPPSPQPLPPAARRWRRVLTAWLPWGCGCRPCAARWTRLAAYLTLMLLRTAGLYLAVNWLEDWFLQAPLQDDADTFAATSADWAPTTDFATTAAEIGEGACDYAHLRRDGRCKEKWNMADHIVLFLTHHIAVAGSELAVLLAAASAAAAAAAASAAAPHGNDAAVPGQRRHSSFFRGFPVASLGWSGSIAALAAVIVVASAAYCTRQTAAFFHTPSESLAGFAVGIVSILAWRTAICRLCPVRWG